MKRIPDALRRFVYIAVVVLAMLSLALAVMVTLGVITDAQVVDTAELWLKYAILIDGTAAGIFALTHFTPDP